jgi:ABC-type enterochelin transport system permease subunit
VLWLTMNCGAFINIALTWMFAPEDPLFHRLVSSAYAAMVGFMIFVILVLDHPFWGKISVEPGAFEHVRTMMEQIEPGL